MQWIGTCATARVGGQKMNKEQINLRLDEIHRTGVITEKDKELLPGVHFCWCWDGLPVAEGCIEATVCTCFEKEESSDE